jgi:hypothetical protein
MILKSASLNSWNEKLKFMTRKWKEVRVKKSSQQELKEEGKRKN